MSDGDRARGDVEHEIFKTRHPTAVEPGRFPLPGRVLDQVLIQRIKGHAVVELPDRGALRESLVPEPLTQ